MATVNRYTQTQENRYTPRTLQELMLAPAYKRGKHDELDASIAEYETALSKYGALDTHEGRLQEEQKKLYDKMIAQRDKLNQEGFSQAAKSDFLRFNKEYQQSVGPQGTIGKIQQAKTSFDTSRKELLAAAMKEGHDLQETQNRLSEQKELYKKEFEETGIVKDFSGILPPSYHDLDSDIKDMKSQLGHIIETELPKGAAYEIFVDNSSGVPLIGIKTMGKTITKNNSAALKAAQEALNNKWLNPNGEGFQSAKWNGMDQETVAKAIASGLNVMHIKEESKEGDDYRFISPSTDNEKDKQASGVDPLVSSPSGSESIPQDVTNVNEIEEQIDAYTAAGDTTNARRLATRLKTIEAEYQTESPEVTESKNKAQAEVETLYQQLRNIKGGQFNVLYNEGSPTVTSQSYDMAEDSTKFIDLAASNALLLRTKTNDAGETTYFLKKDGPAMDNPILVSGGEEIKEFYNTVQKNAKLISAYKTGLDNKIAHEKNQNIKFNVEFFKNGAARTEYETTMKSIIKNHMNSFQAGVVLQRDKGTNEDEEVLVDADDVKDAKELISNAPVSSLHFRGLIMQTSNGVPAVEIGVATDEKDEFGEGKYLVVQLELPKLTTDNTAIQGANNAILETLKMYGGAKAQLLDKKLKQSVTYKDYFPTFNEEDFDQSSKLKATVPYKDEDVTGASNQVGDVLKANGILDNDIDIATQVFKGKAKYSIKYGGVDWANGEKQINTQNVKWGDFIVGDDLKSAPPNIYKHIIARIPKFLEDKGYTDFKQITDQDQKEFVDILKNTDIMVDNYYDLLDILNGR